MISTVLAWFAAAATPIAPILPAGPCTAGEAARATVSEIARDPYQYHGRCVTVSGALSGTAMYSGREGIYRASTFAPDGSAPRAARLHRIGIDNPQLRELQLRHPLASTVTGRVDTCDARQQRAEMAAARRGEVAIISLGGYCHNFGGATIIVDAFQITQQGFERLSGEAARREYGNLAPMPADWPRRAAVEALAADYLAALRTGDRAEISALHGIQPDTRHPDDRSMLYWLLEFTDSPFAFLRNAAPSQTAYFVRSAVGGAPLASDGQIDARVCFCRTADCTGRWPIAANDADADPARPYVCTAIEPRDWTARQAGFSTPAPRSGWLPEPRTTAYRTAANASTR